jgi:putative ABC transport system permease protein
MAKGARPPSGPPSGGPGRVMQPARPGYARTATDQIETGQVEEHDPHLAPRKGLGPGGGVVAAARTPFLLSRFPGIAFAVFTAALILGVATAASPLFLSSASTAAIRQVTAASTGIPALSISTYSTIAQDLADFRDQRLVALTSKTPQLGPPVETVVGGRQNVTNPLAPNAGGPTTVVAFRTGAGDHLQFAAGGPGNGVWIADSVARPLGVEVGDTIVIGSQPGVRAKVAGIYRSLAQLPRENYWAPVAGLVYPVNPNAPAPPPLLLAPKSEFYRIESVLGDQGQYRWELPLRSGDITLPEAQRLSGAIAGIIAAVNDPSSELGSGFQRPATSSPVPDLVTQATQTVGALDGPVGTLAIAGRVVAFAVVAAAGLFLVTRRRVEFTFLNARGVGPLRLAGKCVAEAIVPAAAGAALGWLLAIELVKWLGPTDTVTSAAVQSAAKQVFWSTLAAVLVLGLVSALAVRGESEARMGGRLRTVAARFPWEIIVLALAAASYYEVVTRGASTAAPGSPTTPPPTVDRLLLLFPILFIAGFAGLAVRVLRGFLPRLHAYGRSLPTSGYLAIRRLASVTRLATTLVTAAALGVGILIFAGVFTQSVERTANTKALVSVGSDVSVPLGVYPDTPPKTAFPSTAIAQITGSTLQPGSIQGTTMAIDPRTFTKAAFWDSSFADRSEDDLLQLLSNDSGGRLPIVVAGADVPIGPGSLDVQSVTMPVDIVANTEAFPGMPADQPLYVAAVGPLSKALTEAGSSLGAFDGTYALWARGDAGSLLPQMQHDGYPVELAITADAVRQTPQFLALSWVFGFLEALGVLAGMVALVALVLYLQARQRSREVAYALERRMGLRKRSNFVSVVFEILGMLLAALVIGGGLAVAAAFLLYKKADPMPGIPPNPLLQLPLGLFLLTGALLAAAALVSAWWVQRTAERANVAEVMRLAGS